MPAEKASAEYVLTNTSGSTKPEVSTLSLDTAGEMEVVTHPEITFKVDRSSGRVSLIAAESFSIEPSLALSDVAELDFESVTSELSEDGTTALVRVTWRLREDNRFLTVHTHYTLRSYSKHLEIEAVIHNSQAAQHSGGLWDLGDPGSEYVRYFALCGSTSSNTGKATLAFSDETLTELNDFALVQHSSGQVNWQSKNHIAANGQLPFTKKDYELHTDGNELTGDTTQPKVTVNDAGFAVQMEMQGFWQNFPSGVSFRSGSLNFEMFPDTGYLHELQAGEQKTHVIQLAFGEEGIPAKVRLSLDAEYLAATEALFLFHSNQNVSDYPELVSQGLESEDNFFAKRISIDEFGWRNFGDIFADHETLGDAGKNVEISHYNNQYDPLYGFIRQYLITGENQWFELAEDLARHIIDIDLYKTELDRDEYNWGLFWHTDHYLDAHTCTHRTFSQHHSHAYDGYTPGGGPGGQHCYSLGLYYYYVLTGSSSAKYAVERMASWIAVLFDGTDGVMSTLLGIKKSGSVGLKNRITGLYPFDRGTANMINSQLDAFGVTNDSKYLEKSFDIIRHTFHPKDDIDQRNLGDVEGTWFYTVFLQSVVRFLLLKLERNELDSDFAYARTGLLHYCKWMANSESLYLDKPEKLEFPNTTWAAQDVRKVYLMSAASYFDENDKDVYRHKATQWHQRVVDIIADCDTKDSARILALLMQNDGGLDYFTNLERPKAWPEQDFSPRAQSNKYISITKLAFRALFRLSIRRELNWLAARSAKVSKWVGRK